MTNATLTAHEIAKIEADAQALRAEMTYNMVKTIAAWVRGLFAVNPSVTSHPAA